MFEQESYNYQMPEVRPQQPGDLFYNYEIRNWNFSPRLYKILAGSAIFNILALVIIGSSGMLTTRGCDSPFVGRVCQVLDTVYVGSLLFGTDSEYSDVDYDKTELADADVTFVDVTGVSPPLTYPAGYFQLANPEQQFTNMTDPMAGLGPDMIAPGIPRSAPSIGGSGLINTPQIMPNANPNAVQGSLPTDGPLGPESPNPTTGTLRKGRRGGRPSADPTANANKNPANNNANVNPTVAGTPDEAKEDKNGITINKRPLKDKATETLAQVDAGKVKLENTFRVVISGTLGLAKDGKTIILTNPKAEPVDKNFPADPAMTKLAQEWVVAVGDAGWYGYLGIMDDKKGVGRKVVITIEQNSETFLANLRSEQPTPERANVAASGLKNLMTLGAIGANDDDLNFLKSTQTASDGNTLVVNFQMPKPQVQEMIQRKLAEMKEKIATPEGNAFVKPGSNTAER
ncbi:MAG: hypothetical protein DMF63_07270 [Acidobacteria bacterium]|nr:MAG: hypothetical protein DMF63_07270 [Acidobacteriota bacterium]